MLSSNIYVYDKLLNPTALGLAKRLTQIYIGLASCQTQHPWAQSSVESTYIRVWRVVRPNILKCSQTLSPNTCGFDNLVRPNVGPQDSDKSNIFFLLMTHIYFLSWAHKKCLMLSGKYNFSILLSTKG